ncbi:MAG TPA: HAMP domain-containing sensor histidine kinase [Streptosporangiaceae bacterium]|nr:HAMP domain-containing sensor histidine kinase [Streptosporangiaceae bacterium]
MSAAGGTGRAAWQRLRSLPGRTPLRVKMITAVLALMIIALGLISFASRAIFGGYLTHQAEIQLTDYYQSVYGKASRGHLSGSLFVGNSVEQVWILNSRGQPIQVLQNGIPLVTSGTPPPEVPTSQAWLNANAGQPVTVPGPSASDNWLVITQQIPIQVINGPGQFTNSTAILVVGTDLGNIRHEISYLTEIDLLVSVAVIVILAIVGIAVVRASLRPLTDIEQTAAAIAAGDLSSRVPDRDPRTEVGRLGLSLNAMLTQIETAFHARTESEEAARRSESRMRQFVADASHELRTPLTAIRGYAEYYRQRGGVAEFPGAAARPALGNGAGAAAHEADKSAHEADAAAHDSPLTSGDAALSPRTSNAAPQGAGPLARADLDRIMQRVEQESSRMGVLVEDMLLLARLDQQRPMEQRTVDMLTLAADAVNDARVVAPNRHIGLTVGVGAALLVVGDEVRLRQVIGNLMSNALNHTPDGTPIEVRVRSGSLDEWRSAAASAGRAALAAAQPFPAVIVEVADQGPGLTPYQAEHVFERFYRADQARTRKAGGTGLGLAIVAALVAAHGGTVWVESPPGGGATFRIAIPLAPEAMHSEPDPEDGTGPDILGSDGTLGMGSGARVRGPAGWPSAQ